MISKTSNFIKDFLLMSVSSENKKEFTIGINKINISRGKYTAITFIVLEAIMIIILLIKNKTIFRKSDIYYLILYILMIVSMVFFLLLFVKIGKNINKYGAVIPSLSVAFIGFLLIWSVFISLLDQWSSGQIIVYTVAIISIAVTPVFKPITLLNIYLIVQALFFILLPHFQCSGVILFDNYVNSTAFLIISWVISYMRYGKQVEDFNNKKIIQKQSDELKRINKELDKLSRTDSLTGVYNRFMFDKKIKDGWDKCKTDSVTLSLILVDIDFFKEVNDNYGHQAGDDCIKQVSGILSTCIKRPSDILARYGGDEFAFLLIDMDKESVFEFATNLRVKIEQSAIPHMYSSVSKFVTISLGVCSVIPSDSSTIDKFINDADKVLYKAKINHNNLVIA